MGKKILLALGAVVMVFSSLWAKGDNNLNRWIQEFQKGDSSQKKSAIEEIALIKNAQAMEFLYKSVLISNDANVQDLKVFAVEKMASSKVPHGFYYIFQSFTLGNMNLWPRFKEAVPPHINAKILLQLSNTVLSAKADQWAPGKAFFVELLALKKVKKASKSVESLLLQDPSPEVRKACVFAIFDLDRSGCVPYLSRALGDRDDEVKKAVLIVLGEMGTSTALKQITLALSDKSQEIRLAAVEVLSRQKDPTAAQVLLKSLKDSDKEVRTAALRGLKSIWGDRAKESFVRACQDGDWEIRMVAVYYLKEFGKDGEFLRIYSVRLRDPYYQVASAAVWGLYHLATRDATQILIESLSFLKEAPLQDAARALKELTGQDFGTQHGQWLSWWNGEKKNFSPKPQKDQTYYPKDSSTESGSGRGSVLRKPKFFGSAIESYHVGFVIDFSGSMSTPMTVAEEEESGHGTVQRSSPKTTTSPRIEVAKKELINAIAALDPRAKFNVFIFGTSYVVWKEKAVVATPENKDSAIGFVKSKNFMGQTNLYDPLEKMLNDRDIDTIYVLTDGAPNHGKYSNPNEILKGVQEINQTRKVIIHAIGIGLMSFTEEFLKDLAKQNYGKFTKK